MKMNLGNDDCLCVVTQVVYSYANEHGIIREHELISQKRDVYDNTVYLGAEKLEN